MTRSFIENYVEPGTGWPTSCARREKTALVSYSEGRTHQPPYVVGRGDNVTFTVQLEDGREAECWQAINQEYKDCVFSAGLVSGIEPDTVYLRLEKDSEEEPLTLFLRPDEMLAILFVCSGALWSDNLTESVGEHDGEDV